MNIYLIILIQFMSSEYHSFNVGRSLEDNPQTYWKRRIYVLMLASATLMFGFTIYNASANSTSATIRPHILEAFKRGYAKFKSLNDAEAQQLFDDFKVAYGKQV